jgi:hypothetical protein
MRRHHQNRIRGQDGRSNGSSACAAACAQPAAATSSTAEIRVISGLAGMHAQDSGRFDLRYAKFVSLAGKQSQRMALGLRPHYWSS